MSNVKVHDGCNIWQTKDWTSTVSVFGRVKPVKFIKFLYIIQWKTTAVNIIQSIKNIKEIMSNKNMAAQLRFEILCLKNTQNIWNNVLWTDEIKAEIIVCNAQHHIWITPKHSKSLQTPNTNCKGRWWGEYSRARCEAICPIAKVWPLMNSEAKAQQQIYTRMTE